ncbi:terminase small subunit [Klebsiella aerogenes]|uniref:terminase small subunit n=1 Tax=Klebsiella aerogenes TaxID=548 RepID=UPI00351D2D1B
MARRNWEEEQARFLAEHAETGISPEDWCKREGINYKSAKRYIKITSYKTANSQKKSAKKTANSQKSGKPESQKKKQPVRSVPVTTEATYHTQTNPEAFGLSEQQVLFAELIVQGKSRVDAYREAGYQGEGNTAYSNASRMLRNARVSRYIHHLRNERQHRYAAELDDVIAQLMAIINADPNEIAQYRRVNCRYCWGLNHKYQWKDVAEQLQAERMAEANKKPPPDLSGGVGFVVNMDPNPECPRCNGEGTGEAFFADTRDLEGDARYLLQGVKVGKFGIEIMTADKDAARRELARLLVVRGADERQVQLNLHRLDLQNQKLQAEIDAIKRNAPPDNDENSPDGFEIEFIEGPKHDDDADPVE